MDILVGDAECGASGDQRGFGLVGLIASMAILGLLAVIAVKSIPTGTANAPGIAPIGHPVAAANTDGGATPAVPGGLISQAGDTAAQEDLRSALAVVDQTTITSGGYGKVDVSSLALQDRGIPFTAGPSTSASQMSVVAAGGTDGGVTLAVRSASGTCWFVWTSSAATWYGVETGRASCAAPALGKAPVAGAGGNGVIGWQPGTFPAP